MAGEKIFIGPKLRELRQSRDLTQAELARELGVSASYVNLIERNQRNASLKFLIALSDSFGLNWRELTNSDTGQLIAELRQISKDPAFGEIEPDVEELRSAVDGSPNLIRGFFNIYNAYRTYGERLAEQNETIAATDGSTMSVEQNVHDLFRNNNNHFPELERCAEQCSLNGVPDRQEMYGALRAHLANKHGVEVIQVRDETLDSSLRYYDAESKKIMLSDRLDHSNKVFQLAHMIGLIEFPDVLINQLPEKLCSDEHVLARCRVELANYFAAAMMMPYEEFHKEAVAVRYDIDRLAAMFSVSYEQVCHRFTTLQDPRKRGIPFFFLRIDRGGNVSKRFNATPIQLARYGGACPRLDVHYCFRLPSRIIRQIVEMPDHSRYLTINRTVDRPSIRYTTEDKRLAVSLGCPVEYAHDTVYGLNIDPNNPRMITEVGVNCRLCPRQRCAQRAHEPFHSDLKLNENRRGITHFES